MDKFIETTLGEVCTFKYGKSLPARNRSGMGNPVYGSNGVVGFHDEALTTGPSLVIGRKGSYGEVHFSNDRCWPIDTTYYVDAESTEADLRWLKHVLPALGLNRLNRAAAVPGLNRDDAYRQKVMLPPLDEQRRIAAILDKADDLRVQRRQALSHVDKLSLSIFDKMFGDHEPTRSKWRKRPLDEMLTIRSGQVDPTEPANGFLPHISPDKVERNTGRMLMLRSAAEDGVTSGKYLVHAGDVVYSKIRPYLNKVAIARDVALCSADMYPLSVVESVTDPEFLKFSLLSREFVAYTNSLSNRANIPKLNRPQLLSYQSICPPLQIQEEFAQRINAVERLKERHLLQLAELDALFASLQHRAFKGEL